jgi:hypothetical protein
LGLVCYKRSNSATINDQRDYHIIRLDLRFN